MGKPRGFGYIFVRDFFYLNPFRSEKSCTRIGRLERLKLPTVSRGHRSIKRGNRILKRTLGLFILAFALPGLAQSDPPSAPVAIPAPLQVNPFLDSVSV